MFGMFSRKPIEKTVIRDEIAQKVCDILFPPHIEREEDGQTFIVDYSVDYNLLSALVDLENGANDEVTQNTIRSVITKLGEARELLVANYPIAKAYDILSKLSSVSVVKPQHHGDFNDILLHVIFFNFF